MKKAIGLAPDSRSELIKSLPKSSVPIWIDKWAPCFAVSENKHSSHDFYLSFTSGKIYRFSMKTFTFIACVAALASFVLFDGSIHAGGCVGTKYFYNPAAGCIDVYPSGDFSICMCTKNGASCGNAEDCCVISGCTGSCSNNIAACPYWFCLLAPIY